MIDQEKTDAFRQRLQSLKGGGQDSNGKSFIIVAALAIGGLLVVAAKIYLFHYIQKLFFSRASIEPLALLDSFIVYVFVATLIPWSKLWKRKSE